MYVADRHRLGLKELFGKENPHARQYLLARLLEVDRQGSHKFSAEQRAELVREYMQSVKRAGVGCSAKTCGNWALQRFVAGEARAAGEAAEEARFEERFRTAYSGRRAEAPRAAPTRGRRLLARLGVFEVPAERFAAWRPSVQVGFSIFLLFLLGSVVLGGVNALGLSRQRSRLVELCLRNRLDWLDSQQARLGGGEDSPERQERKHLMDFGRPSQ